MQGPEVVLSNMARKIQE
jgi:hypothetical protein